MQVKAVDKWWTKDCGQLNASLKKLQTILAYKKDEKEPFMEENGKEEMKEADHIKKKQYLKMI